MRNTLATEEMTSFVTTSAVITNHLLLDSSMSPTSIKPSDLANWVYVVNIIYVINMMLRERLVRYFAFSKLLGIYFSIRVFFPI